MPCIKWLLANAKTVQYIHIYIYTLKEKKKTYSYKFILHQFHKKRFIYCYFNNYYFFNHLIIR